jgi:hypothetical protein
MGKRVMAPCADCGIDTLGGDRNWYLVHSHIWELAWPGSKTTRPPIEGDPFSEILCIDCLEKRLGRDLRPDDFTNASINDAVRNRLFK